MVFYKIIAAGVFVFHYHNFILMLFEFAGKKAPSLKFQAPSSKKIRPRRIPWDLGLGTWNLELIHCKFKFVEYILGFEFGY
jgi:hypothetical protein